MLWISSALGFGICWLFMSHSEFTNGYQWWFCGVVCFNYVSSYGFQIYYNLNTVHVLIFAKILVVNGSPLSPPNVKEQYCKCQMQNVWIFVICSY